MRLITEIGSLVDKFVLKIENLDAFTWRLGLPRSLLALSTLLTLVVTPNEALYFGMGDGAEPSIVCDGWLRSITLGCVSTGEQWMIGGKILASVVLIIVISGILPRWTAIPHWYIALSHTTNATLVDGGDHINLMLVTILLPACLVDHRLSHWQSGERRQAFIPQVVAQAGILLAGIQMSVLYAVAALSKANVPEWADGTALWYWLSDGGFGLPGPLFDFITPLLAPLPVMATMTYGVIVVELLAAGALFYSYRWRQLVLIVMVAFHLLIALAMGLWTFGLSMTAGLVLYLLRPGEQWAPAIIRDVSRNGNQTSIPSAESSEAVEGEMISRSTL